VFYSVTHKTKIKNLNHDFLQLKKFIDGIQTYTDNEIATEDSLIKANYIITVDSIGRPADLNGNIKCTFYALVKVKSALNNKVQGVYVRFDSGGRFFEPKEDGNILIYGNDAATGLVSKECSLYIVNKFGSTTHIGFTFSYTSK
jgi:hypothetical protein